MADVVLVQSAIGAWDNYKQHLHLPLSLLQAAALVDEKYDIKLIDARADPRWEKDLKRELNQNPLCVATTAMTGPQISSALRISRIVKEMGDIPVVWGGPHPSILPKQTLENPLIDYVVIGEGEASFLRLVDSLNKGRPLDLASGLGYKRGGKIRVNLPSELIDLKNTPAPPYHLVDVKEYMPIKYGKRAMLLETSRGCNHDCKFCYNKICNKMRWRSLDVDTSVDRMEQLKEFGAEIVYIIDDNFFVSHRRALQFSQELIRGGIDVQWDPQGLRLDDLGDMLVDDTFASVLKSGCCSANIGIESGSPKTLRSINKGITIPLIRRVNKRIAERDFIPKYNFIVGFPDESMQDIKQTIAMALDLMDDNPKALVHHIACYTPYPQTELYNASISKGFIPPRSLEEWVGYSWDTAYLPWLDQKVRGALESLYVCSLFIDNKIQFGDASPLKKTIASLYQPFAKYRVRNMQFGLMPETFLFKKFANKI